MGALLAPHPPSDKLRLPGALRNLRFLRSRMGGISEAMRIMQRDPNPEHWKWRIFYYNPDEPRLFAPKWTGLPFTLNFARPTVWAIIAIILALVIILAVHNN